MTHCHNFSLKLTETIKREIMANVTILNPLILEAFHQENFTTGGWNTTNVCKKESQRKSLDFVNAVSMFLIPFFKVINLVPLHIRFLCVFSYAGLVS
jgi:hypothetical protein